MYNPFLFIFNRNAFDAYFRRLYDEVLQNLPQNVQTNINTTFLNNNFSTAIGYVSTKMDREDMKDVKQPYARTNPYNPVIIPPVSPDWTNALQIGKLLQLQQWPTCG